jgi:drug/metabolite transporter (DMT)-like permease
MFLSEPSRGGARSVIGCGLAGLAVIFNPQTLNWGDRNALYGSGLILLAAFCWAGNIVYVRAHKWISTPFQLVFWQVLLAACCSRPSPGSRKARRASCGPRAFPP